MGGVKMKASELRIGNYVNRNYDLGNYEDADYRLQCVDLEAFEHIAHSADYIKNFHPIPLTEDVLARCGFVKTKDVCFWEHRKSGMIIFVEKTEKGILFFLDYLRCHSENYYLHQLQNLYFALTGEELIINQNKTE